MKKTTLTTLYKILVVMLLHSRASAELIVHFGPVSVGRGGPNPLSIPPVNPVEYEFVWLSADRTEWSYGISPGLFLYGKRHEFGFGPYMSCGVGAVLSAQGLGPGLYSAFGWEKCGWFCYNIEYKQALGIVAQQLVSPYAVRIGFTLFKH